MISRRTRDALAAKKAQGVKLGGLNAKGIENRDAAVDRAKQLRPIFNELAGGVRTEDRLNIERAKDRDPGGQGLARSNGDPRKEAAR
jgi:DNA invertase Pin-like site-specific DNA recombinase